jgi:hypothetical protein
VRPNDTKGIEVGDDIAIGLALEGDNGAAAPSLSLRGQR